MLFWIAVAMVAGFIGLGSLAGRLQRFGIPVLTSAIAGMTLFAAIQMALIVGPSEWAGVLWLGFGFFGTSGILAYAALAQSFPVQLAGRVGTAVNLLVFIAAFAGQWAIGVIVSWWPEVAKGQFASTGLRTGLTFLLVCQVGALLWFFWGGRRNRGKQRIPAAG